MYPINNNEPGNCDNLAANGPKSNQNQHHLTQIKQVMEENHTILYQTISYQLEQTKSKLDNCTTCLTIHFPDQGWERYLKTT